MERSEREISIKKIIGTGNRSVVSRGGYGGPQADCFGETAIAINDQQLKEKNYISTDGGPQADCFDERELSGMKRELK